MFQSLTDYVSGSPWTYAFLFGVAALDVVFPLVPSETSVILAGVRTALAINVGTATLATFVDGGGLGDTITAGIRLGRETVLIAGAALTAVLALALDWAAGWIESALRPRGL